MTPARFRWGMLFILTGALFLLRNIDVLNLDFAYDLFFYLPLFFIAIGIEKIFTRTRLEAISYLTTAALVAGGIFIAYESSHAHGFADAYADGIEVEPSVTAIYAVVNLDDGDLEIRDSRRGKVYFKFNRRAPRPKIRTVREGDRLNVYFDARQRRFWGGIVRFEVGDHDDWKLAFDRNVPLTLVCNGDESEMYLNLKTTPLRDLEVNANNARITVQIGDLEPYVNVRLRGDESDVRLRIPMDMGLLVTGIDDEAYLSRIGLVRSRNGFVNAGFDTLKKIVEVELDDRFSSLSIKFY